MIARVLVPVLVLAGLVLGAPRLASAQATTGTSGDAAAGMTTLLLTTGGIALSGVGCYVITSKGDDKPHRTAAMLYLRQNALQVRQDLTFGRGPIVDELAAELKVRRSDKPALGKALRDQRRVLLSLADPARLTPERAWQFFDTVRTVATGARKAG